MSFAPHASIVAIHVCVVRGDPLRRLDEAELRAGFGIVGERRAAANNKPKNQLTLVEEEALRAAMTEAKLDLPIESARRNIVTRGVALNHLVGVEFVVGDAVVRGIELCEPCGRLSKLTSPAFSKALVHRGGLRAEIVVSGRAVVGGSIRAR